MKKLFAFLLVPSAYAIGASFAYLLLPRVAFGHCPLCVAGAAAGITLTRWVGVDDSITGVWIGALLGAISFWTYLALTKKRELPWAKPLIYLVIFGLTIWSFYKFNLVIRMSQIMGLDKLPFGIISGGILFYVVDSVKIKHYFNYQKIVISLGSIAALSLVIYILINYYI